MQGAAGTCHLTSFQGPGEEVTVTPILHTKALMLGEEQRPQSMKDKMG